MQSFKQIEEKQNKIKNIFMWNHPIPIYKMYYEIVIIWYCYIS